MELVQNKSPKVDAQTLAPVSFPSDPDLEWCAEPPGCTTVPLRGRRAHSCSPPPPEVKRRGDDGISLLPLPLRREWVSLTVMMHCACRVSEDVRHSGFTNVPAHAHALGAGLTHAAASSNG